MIATPNTGRRKICTGLKLKPRTMSAFVVGVLRSAMRLPSPNASASASGGVEFRAKRRYPERWSCGRGRHAGISWFRSIVLL